MKKLLQIQQKLKAPKNLYNSFGGYAYRSAESILEALKPILAEVNATLLISDELCNIGERYYIRAVVQLFDLDKEHDNLIAETQAFAREEENKKGMDGSQITGASSSYARKYALNGMFMIDEKDSDSTNTFGKDVESEKATYKCQKCGKSISEGAYKNWNGLCADCYKESKKEGK